MDYALLNLAVTIALLAATFAFRKRILRALGRLLLHGAIEFARATFFVQTVEEGPDGFKVARTSLSAAGKGIVAAVAPVLIAEVLKSIKLKPGGGAPGLPAGIDLSNLSSALPALLNSGMVPKKYAGLLALAAPFLQGMLGGAKPAAGKTAENPFLKEVQP